ncbi:MAG: metallopeptidase family protein [Alphaproteobacteria bacterium]|nr:metallopeptidase family protein [Rhodospirillaceae bacterium]MBT6205301.1 metallopeptidase family protein [Rhodospirillaceae bacterium]MBT7646439.1 metallopeptidase family protein [Rhodospirillaceae bacterium]MDG2480133.1 metallopeptidase family protein [Alphaproteobacteria bacterium]
MTRTFDQPPSADEMTAIAEAALALIPPSLLRHVQGLAILVEEFPEAEVLEELEIDDWFGLLGLYQGVALDQRSVSHTPDDLNRIYLYRRPLLDAWASGEDSLEDLIANTLIHEIGHHFGLSDDDMDRLESE